MGFSSCAILVLNYNGVSHLRDCLPSVVVAASHAAAHCTVVVVDNASTDASVAFVREQFPSVEVVARRRNDFLFSLNDVVEDRLEEHVILLNNDIRVDPQFLAPLLSHFEDPEVFAVGAAIWDWEGTAVTVGPRWTAVRNFWFYKRWDLARQETSATLDVCAGAAAFRRSMFVSLRGFDDLYRPGYYEDLDLCLAARMRGWKIIYEPRSMTFHKESASMVARYGAAGKARLLARNHVLFTVKNVGGPGFLIGFFVLLPLRAIRPLFAFDAGPAKSILAALPRVPGALVRRAQRAVTR